MKTLLLSLIAVALMVGTSQAQAPQVKPFTGIAPPPPGFDLAYYSKDFTGGSPNSYNDATADCEAQMSQWYWLIRNNYYYPFEGHFGVDSGTSDWRQLPILYKVSGKMHVWWYKPSEP